MNLSRPETKRQFSLKLFFLILSLNAHALYDFFAWIVVPFFHSSICNKHPKINSISTHVHLLFSTWLMINKWDEWVRNPTKTFRVCKLKYPNEKKGVYTCGKRKKKMNKSMSKLDSMFPCVCSALDHWWRQNVLRT